MESARRAGADFEEFVKYLDSAITTTLLGQSSTTDQGPWKGTAEIQKDVRDEVIAADAHMLDDALNHTISRWLTEWNYPGAAIPRIRRDAEPPEDLDKRAERERIISETTGLKPTQAHVEAVYGGEWEEAPAPESPQPGNQDWKAGAAYCPSGRGPRGRHNGGSAWGRGGRRGERLGAADRPDHRADPCGGGRSRKPGGLQRGLRRPGGAARRRSPCAAGTGQRIQRLAVRPGGPTERRRSRRAGVETGTGERENDHVVSCDVHRIQRRTRDQSAVFGPFQKEETCRKVLRNWRSAPDPRRA